MVHILAYTLPLTLFVNWPAFGIVALVAHRKPGIRALIDRRWLSLGIALLSTTFSVLAFGFFAHVEFGAVIYSLLLTAPVYVLTAVNAVFLWLTIRGKW